MTGVSRSATTWLTERPITRRVVTRSRVGHRIVDRFVAGDDLEAGMAAARSLAGQGIGTMLDHLGENVSSAAQAAASTDAYVRALKRIQEAPELDANISVKLTQLGLDVSTDVAAENMQRVLDAAAGSTRPLLVMIDMEALPYVDRTLDLYMALRERHANIGVCLQAHLRRTASDAHRITGPAAVVRVCKGAYLESRETAFPTRAEVSRSFAAVSATLLCGGSVVHLATHDPALVEGAIGYIRARSISNRRYEFQMLYGVRRDIQRRLVGEGEPVRVYVPYGTEWYPYLTRRLAERPANVWFFLSNLFERRG